MTWNPIRVGNGGIATGFSIQADGTMVCRTDSSGAFLWSNTANTWQCVVTPQRMPAGTPLDGDGVSEIIVDPANSNNIWMSWRGKLYKTTNKANTFTQVTGYGNQAPNSYAENNSSNTKSHGPYIAVDPNNSNVVYASTTAFGCYRTTDGGTTMAVVPALSGGLPAKFGNNPAARINLGTSSANVTPSTGSVTFTPTSGNFGITGYVNDGHSLIKVWSASNPAIQMVGWLTAANTTSFTINSIAAFGSTAKSDWNVSNLIRGEGNQNPAAYDTGPCMGHRIAFDVSGGTTTAFGQTVTKNVYVHTSGVDTFFSNDGGVTFSSTTATNKPETIQQMVCDKFGVLWFIDGDFNYTAATTNMGKYDGGIWTKNLAQGQGILWATSLAVDDYHSPSKANSTICFVAGDHGDYLMSVNGGSTFYYSGGTANRSFQTPPTGDVDWLLDYFRTQPTQFWALCSVKFDPTVTNKLWMGSEGVWYAVIPTSTSPVISYVQQSRGIEEFIPTHIIAPASNTVILGSWDFPLFVSNNFSSFPSKVAGPLGPNQGALTIGYSMDYQWNNSNNICVIVQSSTGFENGTTEGSGYSLDRGVTWTKFANTPYTGSTGAGAQIAMADSNTYVWVSPQNAFLPKITLDRGATWNDIVIPGGTPTSYWGVGAYYEAECKLIESDKSNGDIYLYNVNDPNHGGADAVYKRDYASGIWSYQSSPSFPNNYFVEQMKSVGFGFAGYMFMTSGVLTMPFYYTTDGWVSGKKTVVGVTDVQSFGFSPPAVGQTFPVIGIYGTVSGTRSYYSCSNFNPSTGVGTWVDLGVPGAMIQPKDMCGDPGISGQFYTWTTYGAYYTAGTPAASPRLNTLRMRLI